MADDRPAPTSLLGPFQGEKPPAPAWFDAALAVRPERSRLPVDGAEIELLTWGEIGKPGLLFLHGNGAHADWWSFVAPFFAPDWRVAAISWSGMGDSDWRPDYSAPTFAAEIFAAVAAAGLEAGGVKPILVGHSFGRLPHPVLRRRASRPPARRDPGRLQHPAAGKALEGAAPAPRRRQPCLRFARRRPGPLPAGAAAGLREPVHRRLHRPGVAQAGGGRLDLEVSTRPSGSGS
jgi:pimeloyl-ACP methyl ester carboxylesterase